MVVKYAAGAALDLQHGEYQYLATESLARQATMLCKRWQT